MPRLLLLVMLGIGCAGSDDLDRGDATMPTKDGGVVLCGNGVVDNGETCDVAVGEDQPGGCPTTCDDGLVCTVDELRGDGTCTAECAFTERSLGGADGCCPSGGSAASDPDCSASCGNAILEPGESCDTAIDGSCPASCESADPCVTGSLSGAGTCSAACGFQTITLWIDGDMCCPASANSNVDSDCAPRCGNQVVEAGEACDDGNASNQDECSTQCVVICGDGVRQAFETCDTAIASDQPGSCVTACDDGDPCTDDMLRTDACQTRCEAPIRTIVMGGDGCCLPGTNPAFDSDCPDTCGDGVVDPWESCDAACPTPADCEDGDACTVESVANAGTCLAECTWTAIVTPMNGDGCCPPGEDSRTDGDCVPELQCEPSSVLIDSSFDLDHDLRVVVDAAGVVTAVWIEDGSIGDQIYASQKSGGVWSAAVRVVSSVEDLHDLQLVVDGADVVAVWIEDGPIGDDVQSSRHANNAWSPEVLVESSVEDLRELQVVIDGTGDITLVWIEEGSIGDDLQASRYDGAWSPEVLVWSSVENLHHLRMVIAGAEITAIWIEDGSIGDDVQASRYDGAWSPEVLVWSSVEDLHDLQLIAHGDLTAVWIEDGSIGDDVQASRFSANAWSPEVLVESSVEDLHDLQLIAHGDLTAVWIEDGSIGDDVQASRFSANAWSPEVLVESGLDELHHLEASADAAGNIIASWIEDGSIGDDAHASRFEAAANTWSPEALVESSVDDIYELRIALGANGLDLVWIEGDLDEVRSTECGVW